MSNIYSRTFQGWTVVALAVMLGEFLARKHGSEAAAQDQPKARAPIQALSRQPSEAVSKVFLDPNDTVLLLLDHQTGLFQTPPSKATSAPRKRRSNNHDPSCALR